MSRVFASLASGLLLAALCLALSPLTAGGASEPTPQGEPAASPQGTPAPTPGQPAAGAPTGSAIPRDKDGYAQGFNFPLEPQDGKWLVDAEGRRYFEHEVVKVPGTYTRMFDNTRVKFVYTPPFELLRETDTFFVVKMYATEPSAPVRRGPTPEDLERAAATYQTLTPQGDRLSFAPWASGLPRHGQWRNGFAVADVNGDGWRDIVHGPPRKGGSAPAAFLSDGKGNWRRGSLAIPALPLDYGDAAVADFSGDGRPDLAFASHLRGIVVLVADGKGGFARWSEGIDFATAGSGDTEPAFSSRAIEVADWNGDGRLDIVALGEGPTMAAAPAAAAGSTRASQGSMGVRVYLNQGDGTWRALPESGSRSFGDALVVADLTGDRRADVLVASATQGNRALLYAGQKDGTWKAVPVDLVRPAATFRAVAAADFDGDGRRDLAVGYASAELGVWRTGVDVLLARPALAWERRTVWVESSQSGIWALGAGDLDGDRAADLVAVTKEGASWVFLGDGKGSFAREDSPELAEPELATCAGYQVQLVDLDRDGAAELVGGFAGEGSSLFGDEQCTTGGGLWAWKAARRSGPEQTASQPGRPTH